METGIKAGIAVVGVLVVGYFVFLRGNRVSGAEARSLVEHGARLVDVRTPEEFAAGHIPGAVNVPVQSLDGRFGELGPKDRPVVLYCQSGMRSGRAARMLRSAGFASVHNLGGMSRW